MEALPPCFPLWHSPKDTVASLALMSWILNDYRLYPLSVLLEMSQHLIDVDGWISLPLEMRKQHSHPLLKGTAALGGKWCKVMELGSLYVLLPRSLKQLCSPSCATTCLF